VVGKKYHHTPFILSLSKDAGRVFDGHHHEALSISPGVSHWYGTDTLNKESRIAALEDG